MFTQPRVGTMSREAVLRFTERIMGADTRVRNFRPEHCMEFLRLSDDALENLIVAVTRAQGKEMVRVFSQRGNPPIQKRIGGVIADTLFAIATGVGRFDQFAQLRFELPKGASPDVGTLVEIKKKISAAEPVISRAAASFVREVLVIDGEHASKTQIKKAP